MGSSLFVGRNGADRPRSGGGKSERLTNGSTVLLLAAAVLLLSATGAVRAGDVSRESCIECHGDAAKPPATPETPVLAGQPELYVLYQLVYFRQGQRKNEVMNELMRDMSDDDLRALAAWVATLPPATPHSASLSEPAFERGQALARRHLCANCHEADLSGREHMPRLAGQQEQYLLKALQDYKSGRRVGIQAAMAEVLAPFDDGDLEDLAHYMANAATR